MRLKVYQGRTLETRVGGCRGTRTECATTTRRPFNTVFRSFHLTACFVGTTAQNSWFRTEEEYISMPTLSVHMHECRLWSDLRDVSQFVANIHENHGVDMDYT